MLNLLRYAVIACALLFTETRSYKIVCYLNSGAFSRSGLAKYSTEDIDVNMCTHYIYAFAKLDEATYTIAMQNPAIDEIGYWNFTRLKENCRGIKTLLAIGGWTDSNLSRKYSILVMDENKRKNFAAHARDFLKSYNFDGLDFDWEYPGNLTQKKGFTSMLKDLKEAFAADKLMVTAAVDSDYRIIQKAYDIAGIAAYVDQVHLMAYDFHTPGEKHADHHSRLYPRQEDPTPNLNADYAVHIWLIGGMPRNKLIVGTAVYGRSWTIADPLNTVPPTKALRQGNPGKYVRAGGFLAYYEICENILANGWNTSVDFQSPYAFRGNQWVGYDTPTSFQLKANYIKDLDCGGAMVWEISFDDFRGTFCNSYPYPLLSTLRNSLLTVGACYT